MKVRSLVVLVLSFPAGASAGFAQNKITITNPETAGISMFRPEWDTPIPLAEDGPRSHSFDGAKDRPNGQAAWWSADKLNGKPGAIAIDALNRSVLVRFPDAADKIAAALKTGQKIEKVELVLPFKDEELFPPGGPDYRGADGYTYRANWGVSDLYLANRPRWHAVAWALRRPWAESATEGPTFNAAINGKVFWTKYGAADEKTDRYPTRFGPAEVSYEKSDAMDVTASLNDSAYGATLGQRLRRLADCGFLLQKEETYDHRYFRGVYEWATASGGRGIILGTPKLEVTFAPGQEDLGAMPPAASIDALAARPSGAPTAVIPSDAEIEKLAGRMEQKPAWMQDWQWQRIQELFANGGVKKDPREPLWVMFVPSFKLDSQYRGGYWAGAGDYRYKSYAKPADVYRTWIDGLIGRQPRGWSGFETATEYNEWQVGKDVLPGPALDAIRRYWTAWLMPDRATAPRSHMMDPNWTDGSLVHPMVDQLTKGSNTNAVIDGDSYWLKTGDWRGNKSFFRSGFCYMMSTQNFNTTSSTGAFLFGNLIQSPLAIQDGKHGIDQWLLNGWTLSDGVGQEFIDHYYYSISLKGLKALQNGASDEAGQLEADSLVNKGVMEAVAAWHPNLKRFFAPSSRTSLEYLLGTQDGLNYLMNSFSHRSVLTDVGKERLPGNYLTFGEETPAALVAGLSMQKPWVDDIVSSQVNSKPLPYEMTAWGRGTWNRTFLGQDYGMASALQFSGRIQAMAQWRREAKEVTSAKDLDTMDVRMGFNDTNYANNAGGYIFQPFKQTVMQKGHTWLIAGSPNVWNGGLGDGKVPVKSFQASLGLFDIRELEPNGKPTWDIYLDGQKVESLPVKARAGQSIVIRDGVTYIAVKAMPSPNLGRDAEVVLRSAPEQHYDSHGTQTYKPSLEINSYIVNGDTPLGKDFNWYGLDQSYGGFLVQLGDATEGPFDSFLKRAAASTVSATFDANTNQLTTSGTMGSDTLSLKMVTAPAKSADGKWDPGFQGAVTDLTANSTPAYPTGMTLMDTPLEEYGWNSIEKNGARLSTSLAETGGTRLMLQTSVDKKRYVAWNPQGTAADLKLALPGGLQIRSDGMLGLTRIAVDLQKHTLDVRHAFTDGRAPGGTGVNNTNASALVLTGFPEGWAITINGKPYTAHLALATIAATPWRVLPLTNTPRSKDEIADMLSKMDQAIKAKQAAVADRMLLHYYVAGLFPNKPGAYGPEKQPGHVDLTAAYPGQGQNGADVKWRSTLDFQKNTPVFGLANGSPKLGEGIYFFRIPPEHPTPPGTYYLLATAKSAAARRVAVLFNLHSEVAPPAELKLWVNGKAYDFPSTSGGRVPVDLQAGENQFLIKIRQDDAARGAEQPLLTLGEPTFGLPTLRDVEWKTADGTYVPVNPQVTLVAANN